MALPNPLSRVNEELGRFSGSRFGKGYNIREDATKLLKRLANCTDSAALSYLWMAIELDFNVIILANDQECADSISDALAAFVPAYATALEMPKPNGKLDRRLNFISMEPSASEREMRKAVGELVPDLVIAKENSRIRDIFRIARQGTGFMATATGNFKGRHVVSMLQSGKFNVALKDISMLDISVLAERKDGNPCISSITEYKWLERDEIRHSTDPYRLYRNARMITESKLNLEELPRSKLIEKYSKLNLVRGKDALGELLKRKAFIESLLSEPAIDKQVAMYYEIK